VPGRSGRREERQRDESRRIEERWLDGRVGRSRLPRWRSSWSPESAQEAVWVAGRSNWRPEPAQAVFLVASWSIRVSESAQAVLCAFAPWREIFWLRLHDRRNAAHRWCGKTRAPGDPDADRDRHWALIQRAEGPATARAPCRAVFPEAGGDAASLDEEGPRSVPQRGPLRNVVTTVIGKGPPPSKPRRAAPILAPPGALWYVAGFRPGAARGPSNPIDGS